MPLCACPLSHNRCPTTLTFTSLIILSIQSLSITLHLFKQSLVSCQFKGTISFCCHSVVTSLMRSLLNPPPLHHHLNQIVRPLQPISPSRSLNSVKSSQHEASFLFNDHHSSGSREPFYMRSTSNMELLSQMMYFLPEPKYRRNFFCV